MAQVMTGARASVKINGVVMGFLTGIDVDVEYELTDVDALGNFSTKELAETGMKVSFTANYFKSLDSSNNSAAQIGIDTVYTVPVGSNDVAPGNVKNMRNQTPFTIEIYDDNNTDSANDDITVMKIEGCKFAGGTGQMDAKGIWQGSWKFRGLKAYGI